MNKGGSTSQGLRPNAETKSLTFGGKIAVILVPIAVLFGELLIYNSFYIIAAPYSKLTYNPITIIGRMISKAPILAIAFVAIAFLTGLIMAKALRKESREDPRGFRLAKEQTQGSNHLMKLSEMEEEFDMRDYYDPRGIIMGVNKEEDRLLTIPYSGPKSTPTRNMLVCGTSGSRKTSGVLIGNIFDLIQSRASMVVTDPKGEIYSQTIAAATAYGYNIKIFDIIGKQFEYSDGWDVLKLVRESSDPQVEADVIVNVMIKNIGVFEENFWNEANLNLLKLAILTVAIGDGYVPMGKTDNAAEGRTMEEVYRLISSSEMEKTVKDLLLKDINRKYLRAPFDAWASNSQKEQIRSGLAIKFSILQTEKLTRILSEDEIDFTEFNEKPTILYLMCSDRESTYRSVLALFVNTLFKKMSDIADESPTKRLDIPLYVILEEAKNIGYIPDLSVFIATIRSRNIAIWMCYQNLTQMMDTYSVMRDGKYEWVTIRDNCNIQVCCGADGGSKETLEHFSQKSGMMTIEEITSTKNVSSYVPKAMKFNAREAERKQSAGRAVLLPSEVKDIKVGEILIFKGNSNPAIETKYFYKDHPLFDFRVKDTDGTLKDPEVNPQTHFTHIPRWRRREIITERYMHTGVFIELPEEKLSIVRVKDLHKNRRLTEEDKPQEEPKTFVEKLKVTFFEPEDSPAPLPPEEDSYDSIVKISKNIDEYEESYSTSEQTQEQKEPEETDKLLAEFKKKHLRDQEPQPTQVEEREETSDSDEETDTQMTDYSENDDDEGFI